jgi:uncharacterized protein
MIVSFSVTNFRSFATEETFTLVASKRLGDEHSDHAVPIPDSDERVLRIGVFYGANGAGKSNVMKALQFLKELATSPRSSQKGTGRQPFRFSDLGNQPTKFDLQFVSNGKLYRFGVSVDDEHVIEEWLVCIIRNKEKTIYERQTSSEGKVQVEAPELKNVGQKLAALVTVGGRANQTFLATVLANLEPQDAGADLLSVIAWMSNRLTLLGPDSQDTGVGDALSRNGSFQEFAGNFLKSAGTGIDSLQVERRELLGDELLALLPKPMQTAIKGHASTGSPFALRLGSSEIIFDNVDDERFYQVTVQAVHDHRGKAPSLLDFSEESDGTKRLLDLLPALYELHTKNAVYFIDEIDRSIHPALVYKFLEFFLKRCKPSACQIIVTTHETNLLNLDLLRRDEIWFAEKDVDGATRLYSLTDFAVRKDLQIRKGYLEGRFGAVPFLADLDRLAE